MRKQMVSLIVLLILCVACTNPNKEKEDVQEAPLEDLEETAAPFDEQIVKSEYEHEVVLINRDGERTGVASLEQTEEAVVIHLDAWNLPEGVHGIHIHEKGQCTPPDFESAGGHFNPTEAKHGFDHPEGPHAGDLLNIEVNEEGWVKEELQATMVTLEEGAINSLFQKEGTALVIHAKPDDYISQPAGDAGERIACGPIKK